MSKKIKIDLIAGTRPNFMKVASLVHAIKNYTGEAELSYRLIHTGQHYDKQMSEIFFDELQIPEPEINFGAGGGTQAEQTAQVMLAYERLLNDQKPDLCVVVGDVTSTMACTIAARKMCVKVAHVEAGIRSGDLTMPEEINRILTDSICNYFYTTTEEATQNLVNMGQQKNNIFFVGNTMIDTLLRNENNLKPPTNIDSKIYEKQEYALVTLHRPSNVDNPISFNEKIKFLCNINRKINFIFPVHPRTMKSLSEDTKEIRNLFLTEPLSYFNFIYLLKNCKFVVTDSGGVTEEATMFKTPCITMRDTTERPETVTLGSNILVGSDLNLLKSTIERLLVEGWKNASIPPRWDGKSGDRIINSIVNLF